MSGEQNPLFTDPALMRVNPQAASQPADGSPPRYGTAVAPDSTAFHTRVSADPSRPWPPRRRERSPSAAAWQRRLRRPSAALRAVVACGSTGFPWVHGTRRRRCFSQREPFLAEGACASRAHIQPPAAEIVSTYGQVRPPKPRPMAGRPVGFQPTLDRTRSPCAVHVVAGSPPRATASNTSSSSRLGGCHGSVDRPGGGGAPELAAGGAAGTLPSGSI